MTYTKKFTAAFALAVAVAFGGTTNADTWTGLGADNEFSTVPNWSGTPSILDVDFTGDITGAFTVERTVDSNVDRVFVNGGAVLNVPSGTHSSSKSNANRRDFVGRGGTGTINQSGGTYDIGHLLSIGGGGENGNGVYNLTGGTLNCSRGANSLIDDLNPNGRPSLEVGDEEAAGSALLEISGGSLITRFAAGVGPNGVFSVVGSDATIDIGNLVNGSGDWVQKTGGTLKAAIDAVGITKINVNDLAASGDVVVEFEAGSFLDLGFESGVTPVSGTWTLLEAEGADIVDSGLALSGTTASGWSFAVDNSGANGLLTATYTGGSILLGDVNLSGEANFLDISPFISVLSTGGNQAEADCNESGSVDFLDISPFIAILSGS